MRWAEISLVTNSEAADAVTNVLISEGSGGVASAVSSPRDLGNSRVPLAAYFPVDDRLAAILERIESRIEALGDMGINPGGAGFTVKFVEDADWATAWKSFFKPLVVGKIVVKPTWEEFQAKPGQLILELDPGMAFGTGNHPTTQMCLMAVQRYLEPGDIMLDMGCGSGILAIAGALLGASKVVGVEIDPVAVKAAKDNVAANGVESIVQIVEADTPSAAGIEADLVIANIVADVIIGMSAELAAALRPNGILVVSGIIEERRDEVADALSDARLHIIETTAEGEWISVAAAKPTTVNRQPSTVQ
ncbi:MAG: 50S ribosomal protein L11 methyltransferase [Armatimonadota bacterium]|nr:50S ribosomal protein L11 methyltransferase [Armatimonadota bacterium]